MSNNDNSASTRSLAVTDSSFALFKLALSSSPFLLVKSPMMIGSNSASTGVTGTDKQHQILSFRFHHHDRRGDGDEEFRDVPKGCFGILVGQGEEQRRFVIPVAYVNHPRFAELLKEAEEEFGFEHQGPIVIPCHVEEFRTVQDLIDKESGAGNGLHHHHHHRHHGWCF